MSKRVVVVGGGITGLATAHALEKARDKIDVIVLEGADRLGGNLVTVRHNGFIIDGGPDSWIASKPQATRLAREVGLGDELIGTRPDTRKVYIVWQKKLHPMPEGLVLGVPTEMRPFLDTDLLGIDAKLRAGLDLVVPRRHWVGDEDESIAAFVSRRLGTDVAERIVGPLLGGIFAGDAHSLSVRACVPQLVDAEEQHGSLIRAMREQKAARRAEADGARSPESGEAVVEPSAFLSLKRGVGDLVLNVAHRLRDADVRTSTPARKIGRTSDGRWAVETASETILADAVALTLPAHGAARITADLDDQLSSMLGAMDYVSTATVFLAYKKFDVRNPLDAFGFLVPRAENRPILACTYVSSKWDHRAPAGQALLRVFVGGAGNERLLERDDESLSRLVREQILDLLGIDRPPMFTKVFRFDHASPQPHVGHLARMEALFKRVGLHRGLYVGGNGYVGTGIPDAIKQGEAIAAHIMEDVGTQPSSSA
jgi:oxygen-dependent protoporphyrinogen oxidase